MYNNQKNYAISYKATKNISYMKSIILSIICSILCWLKWRPWFLKKIIRFFQKLGNCVNCVENITKSSYIIWIIAHWSREGKHEETFSRLHVLVLKILLPLFLDFYGDFINMQLRFKVEINHFMACWKIIFLKIFIKYLSDRITKLFRPRISKTLVLVNSRV